MSSMSFLWMCLSLLYAATESSGQVVSLRCNQTVKVTVGETAVLNCSIFCAAGYDCVGKDYSWQNTNGSKVCNSGSKEYKCEWDNQTYVSLTISNVTKEENYTINIMTDAGIDDSSTKVLIKPPYKHSTARPGPDPKSTSPHVTPAVLSVFAVLLVSGILYFLFGNGRGRKMIKCIKKEKTHGHSRCTDTAGEEKTDCLTNLENSV